MTDDKVLKCGDFTNRLGVIYSKDDDIKQSSQTNVPGQEAVF